MSSLERCPCFRGSFVHISMYVAGTIGTVLIREVALLHKWLCAHLYVAGAVGTVLIFSEVVLDSW